MWVGQVVLCHPCRPATTGCAVVVCHTLWDEVAGGWVSDGSDD